MSSRRSVGSSPSGISSSAPFGPVGLHVDPLVGIEAELVVQLQPTDPREVVALGVEEQVVEEVRRGVDRRRIARAQAPVDLDDRLFRVTVLSASSVSRSAVPVMSGSR